MANSQRRIRPTDSDRLVTSVDDEQIAIRSQGDAARTKERCTGPTPICASVHTGDAGDCLNRAVGSDPADGVVLAIGDEEISGRLKNQTPWTCKPRENSDAVVGAAVASQTGKGGDKSIGADFANGTIAEIGHIDVSTIIGKACVRGVEASLGQGAILPPDEVGEPGQGGDVASGRNFPNHLVVEIAYVQKSIMIHFHSHGCMKPGGRAVAVVGAARS